MVPIHVYDRSRHCQRLKSYFSSLGLQCTQCADGEPAAVQANGVLRDMVCRSLLLELQRAGLIELPGKRLWRSSHLRWKELGSLDHQAKGLRGVTPSMPKKSFAFSVRMMGMLSRIMRAASCRSK